jgi:hypothetical protein
LHRVCGRVLVFTNSELVEYLNEDKDISFPLFATNAFAEGRGVTFLIEMNGFLVVDRDCFVKIHETDPYVRTEIDQCKFLLLSGAGSGGGDLGGVPYTPPTGGGGTGPVTPPPIGGGTPTAVTLTKSVPITDLLSDVYRYATFTFSDGSGGAYRAKLPENYPATGTLKSTVLLKWELFDPNSDNYKYWIRHVVGSGWWEDGHEAMMLQMAKFDPNSAAGDGISPASSHDMYCFPKDRANGYNFYGYAINVKGAIYNSPYGCLTVQRALEWEYFDYFDLNHQPLNLNF